MIEIIEMIEEIMGGMIGSQETLTEETTGETETQEETEEITKETTMIRENLDLGTRDTAKKSMRERSMKKMKMTVEKHQKRDHQKEMSLRIKVLQDVTQSTLKIQSVRILLPFVVPVQSTSPLSVKRSKENQVHLQKRIPHPERDLQKEIRQ